MQDTYWSIKQDVTLYTKTGREKHEKINPKFVTLEDLSVHALGFK